MHRKKFDDYRETMARHPEQPHSLHVGLLASLSAKPMEALAGVGDLAGARAVVASMLEVDRSEQTLSLLRLHAARADHPELIPPG
jgi:hypothetical protein